MKDNYCVIMGGGIGSRFWPFSRESYPKQFLDFFGSGRSLLQMTFDRFAKIIPTENIYIVTNESYADLIKEQLPELAEEQILLEPARRNTAPCIAYAAYHIKACNPEANIVVAPSDHLILKEDVFLRDVQKALDFVKRNRALVTLGIKPSRPETEIPAEEMDKAMELHQALVEAAAENDDTLMEKFIEEGALSEDDMRAGIRAGLVTRGMFPVFCVCAGRDMCVRRTLEFLGNVVPCTDKMPRLITTEGVEVTPDSNGPTSLFYFKTTEKPNIGQINYIKVIS